MNAPLTEEEKKIRKAFEKQFKKIQPLTREEVAVLKSKTYFDGTLKNEGDIVLFALMPKDSDNTALELISINANDIDKYMVHPDREYSDVKIDKGKLIPVIIEKTKKE